MHELTRKSEGFSNNCLHANCWHWSAWEKEVLLPYMTKQSDWLKKELYPENGCTLVSNKTIDTAFGLSKPTLEEKIQEMLKESHNAYTSLNAWRDAVRQKAIHICREHFKENPNEL